MSPTPDSQRGNALFLILLAVVLFAALSYAILQNNKSGGKPEREITSMAASGIIQYGQAIQNGFSLLLMRGKLIDDIETLTPLDMPEYEQDAHKPVNVFHPEGGNIAFQLPDPAWVTALIPTTTRHAGNWYFLLNKGVAGVGTGAPERIALLKDVRLKTCEAINSRVSGSSDIPVITQSEAALIADGGTLDDGADTLKGLYFYCVKPGDTSNYFYYHVVAER